MPDDLELDEITARLVSELAATITPALTQKLNEAVRERLPESLADDFLTVVDRSNMISQDLKNQMEKSMRSNIEDNRASRAMIMQSQRSVFDEIMALRKNLDKVPEFIEAAMKNKTPEENQNPEILERLEKISGLVKELIDGLRNFSETYAGDKKSRDTEPSVNAEIIGENSERLDKLLNTSMPALEGLVKAHEKAQSIELEGFSKEISALHKENDRTIIFKLKEAFQSGLDEKSKEIISEFENIFEERDRKIFTFLKIVAGLSGLCAVLSLINLFI